jgi:hypothetical protein
MLRLIIVADIILILRPTAKQTVRDIARVTRSDKDRLSVIGNQISIEEDTIATKQTRNLVHWHDGDSLSLIRTNE